MKRPLRLPLFLAASAVTGILGLLLSSGVWQWPLLALVALPLLVGAYAWRRRSVFGHASSR